MFNDKARKWIVGRRGWESKLKQQLKPGERRIWVHCSSLGEFEQGRPIIETLKVQYPEHKIVLTFFSPSGYEVRKDYSYADYVVYLPMDSSSNARKFISLVVPELTIFVKYEFWFHYLYELNTRNIPLLLVSAAFREDQVFFKWYGGLFRKLLGYFSVVFVQDELSKKLLLDIGLKDKVVIAGDSRYDRVSAIASARKEIEPLESYKGDGNILIAGSTWQDDEDVLKKCIAIIPKDWKIVIAPHEIDQTRIEKIQELFSGQSILYTELQQRKALENERVLIINNIGMLSSLYYYGDIAFIGGGFQKGGIHNVLEPAVFGLPILFGPVYKKFVEANALVGQHFAFPVSSAVECQLQLKKLIENNKARNEIRNQLKEFMKRNTGTTEIVIDWIKRENWLAL